MFEILNHSEAVSLVEIGHDMILVAEHKTMSLYFWASPDRAQQLGAVADGGGSVGQRGGELGRLGEVVFLVLKRLVLNTWRMEANKQTYNDYLSEHSTQNLRVC